MDMKNTFIGLIAVSLLAASCKKDERATYLKEEASAGQPNVALNTTSKTALMEQAGIQSSTNPSPMATAPGMNPPHGQPGHRCDIPVGQPLNSKPAAAPQPAQNVVQTTQAPAPAAQSLAMGEKPKLNPAHGEPWHSCSLKVGDPLP